MLTFLMTWLADERSLTAKGERSTGHCGQMERAWVMHARQKVCAQVRVVTGSVKAVLKCAYKLRC